MNNSLKKLLLKTTGIILLFLGIIGLFLPFLQGFLMITSGLLLLGGKKTKHKINTFKNYIKRSKLFKIFLQKKD